MAENLRIGELCPVCHKGHLYPSGKVERKDETSIYRYYKCDICGHECKNIERVFSETVGAKDSLEKRIGKQRVNNLSAEKEKRD